jgi:multisubunit Na+/H+ antiporter MnhB subunit
MPDGAFTLKVVAAVVTIIGLVFGFLERYFAPNAIVTEDSPDYPRWLAWLGWVITALGILAYIVADFFSR